MLLHFFTLCFALLHCLFSSYWCHPLQCYYTGAIIPNPVAVTKLSKNMTVRQTSRSWILLVITKNRMDNDFIEPAVLSAARVIPHLIPKAVAGSVNFYASVLADLVQ